MKLTTRLKRTALCDSTRYRTRYLDELIEFGGEAMTRGEVIATMQREGHPQPCIDRWLQGQEHAARNRASRERLQTSVLLPASSPTA